MRAHSLLYRFIDTEFRFVIKKETTYRRAEFIMTIAVAIVVKISMITIVVIVTIIVIYNKTVITIKIILTTGNNAVLRCANFLYNLLF